jgi:hypothetical protein
MKSIKEFLVKMLAAWIEGRNRYLAYKQEQK